MCFQFELSTRFPGQLQLLECDCFRKGIAVYQSQCHIQLVLSTIGLFHFEINPKTGYLFQLGVKFLNRRYYFLLTLPVFLLRERILPERLEKTVPFLLLLSESLLLCLNQSAEIALDRLYLTFDLQGEHCRTTLPLVVHLNPLCKLPRVHSLQFLLN